MPCIPEKYSSRYFFMEKNILERKIEQLTDNLTLEVAEYEWIV